MSVMSDDAELLVRVALEEAERIGDDNRILSSWLKEELAEVERLRLLLPVARAAFLVCRRVVKLDAANDWRSGIDARRGIIEAHEALADTIDALPADLRAEMEEIAVSEPLRTSVPE